MSTEHKCAICGQGLYGKQVAVGACAGKCTRQHLLDQLSAHDHGDGCLGIIVDSAIKDGITDVETIREICREAEEDARIEKAREEPTEC